MSKSQPILISNVMVLDSTGSEPFPGEVLVADERIVDVRRVPTGEAPEGAERVNGRGHTLMSGLCDAHTHFTWNEGDLDALATLPVEEHVLHSMRSARIYIDHGYTMCVGAASAKSRLDVVMRDAINRREIQGPRYLANGMEIAVTGGQLVSGITQFADGPEEMRKVVRETISLGVDTIKLSMSGEEITGRNRAADNYFSDEEVEAAVREAHRRGVRVAVHARAAESVRLALRHGADIIYHASFIDDEGMDMLEERKDSVFVAPGLNWLIATLNEAGDFGYPRPQLRQPATSMSWSARSRG
ncbi:amidohydrolase family protein [Raineyella fluvialis]|uniref:amidohydrolase family protein n=1 Tax=Raineyella fluvialis TaxID=2662261 RepID=UPI002410B85C|nr:amidohydrolase family protein [Raineyella fluvialis]